MIRFKTYSAIKPVSCEIIESAVRDNPDKEIIFVAPEFSKAQVEREVLGFKEINNPGNGLINSGDKTITLSSSLVLGDVISFRKLAGNILDELGTNYVAEGGEIMLRNAIYNVLTNNKNKLKAFGSLSSRIDYINLMIALLGDFSRYGVGVDDIDKAIESIDDKSTTVAFINKLKDLHLIMKELEEMNVKYGLNLLREPIALACDRLSNLTPDKLSSRRAGGLAAIIRSKIVFIGFGATRMLTPKEIRLITLLSDLGCDIEFNVITSKRGSTFSSVYKNGEDFRSMLEGLGAVETSLEIPDKQDELSVLVNGFASDYYPEKFDSNGKVRLAELSGVDDRVGYIFNEVINLTRNQGYRYRDIRIVCCNEDIMTRMRSTAEIYGLDVFIDRKIALDGTVIPYMMRTMLELPVQKYPLNLVMNAMRSGMLCVPPYIADSFENFCYAKNITDATRLFDENAYIETGEDQREHRKLWIWGNTVPGIKEGFVDSGKFFYDYIVKERLVPLKEACNKIYSESTLSGKARKSLEYFSEKKGYIEALKSEFLSRGDSASAVALVRGYDELVNLLMCCTHEMSDCEIEQKDFLSMIRTDMRNRTEGTIPLKVDSIEITTPEHAFVTSCKVLFIIGAQKDNFPYVRMREGLLSGKELNELSGATENIKLPDKAQSKMREEFTTACLLLGSATDILYMVHEYGKPKSRVFEYLELYTKDAYHMVNSFKNPIAGEAVTFRHHFENAKIPSDVMDRLLTTTNPDGSKTRAIYASVSSIESFRRCAFQYMLQRQFKIDQREDNTQVATNKFGTLIHGMFECAYRTLRDDSGKDPKKFEEMAKELLENPDKYDAFADDCLKGSVCATALYGVVDKDGKPVDRAFEMDTYTKLKRMFTKTFRDVLNNSLDTGFVPEGLEERIGGDNLVLNIPYSGVDLKFSGFIDRYDIKTDENGKVHVRTIDYKSGKKEVKSAELLNGVQIQLPAYSGAIADKYSSGENTAVIDDYGYILLGLKAEKGDEEFRCIPKLSGYNEQAMKIAIDYSKHIIKESVDQIVGGKADSITVTSKSENCGYCMFKGCCGNNPSAPKGKTQIDLSSGSKYGLMVAEAENLAKAKNPKESDLDEVTKIIGADKSMGKSDRTAILAMKDILDNAGKNNGKEA